MFTKIHGSPCCKTELYPGIKIGRNGTETKIPNHPPAKARNEFEMTIRKIREKKKGGKLEVLQKVTG